MLTKNIDEKDILKIRKAVIKRYRYALLTIFGAIVAFSLIFARAFILINDSEEKSINYAKLEISNVGKIFDAILYAQFDELEKLTDLVKKDIEQQVNKESGNLKNISIKKIYSNIPALNNIDIDIFILDKDGAYLDHPEASAYANFGRIENTILDRINDSSTQYNSVIYTRQNNKTKAKKIVFAKKIKKTDGKTIGFINLEVSPNLFSQLLDKLDEKYYDLFLLVDSSQKIILEKNNIATNKNTLSQLGFISIPKHDEVSIINSGSEIFKKFDGLIYHRNSSDNLPIHWVLAQNFNSILNGWQLEKKQRYTAVTVGVIVSIIIVYLLFMFYASVIRSEISSQINLAELAINIKDKNNLVALISHEIKTPINVILGLSQMSEDPSASKEDLFKNVTSIKSATQYLIKLVDEILNFNKISFSKITLDENYISGDAIINSIIFLFKNRSKNDVKLSFKNLTPENVLYKIDLFQVKQVLINLIENSFKFTKSGYIEFTLEEVLHDEDVAKLKFSVSDSGIGINDSELDLIFLPFTQANSSINRNFGGTGLGLSISQKIVEVLGGKLQVISETNKGSIFFFELSPSWKISEEPIPKSSSISSPVEPVNTTNISQPPTQIDLPAKVNFEKLLMPGKILVVDDHSTTLEIMRSFLEKIGLTVVTAESGKVAIEKFITDGPFDIIVMDIQMPELSGIETTKVIRLYEDQKLLKRVPIIALSANSTDEDKEECAIAGLDDFIEKPANFNRIHQVINTWIRS